MLPLTLYLYFTSSLVAIQMYYPSGFLLLVFFVCLSLSSLQQNLIIDILVGNSDPPACAFSMLGLAGLVFMFGCCILS